MKTSKRRSARSPELEARACDRPLYCGMRSVADDLRAESRQRALQLSPYERVQLALTLGEADVELLSAARALSTDEAVDAIRLTRRYGRRPSISIGDQRP